MSRVVVLFGGRSNERLVSVASAQNVVERLPRAEPWFLADDGRLHRCSSAELSAHLRPFEVPFRPHEAAAYASIESALESGAFADAVLFLSLHGGEGEDGALQAQLERRRIAFTGSGSAASAAAFDKAKAKSMVGAQGATLATAELLEVADAGGHRSKLESMLSAAPRWVLKPVADGSSYGLVFLNGPAELEAAAAALAQRRVRYLAEHFIEGRELTVGVADFEEGIRALPVSEVRLKPGGAFDYAGKYLGKGTEEITPAQLTEKERASAQALALLAHQALGCSGYTRTDMMLTASGPVFLETNTLPGLTKASFIPQQLAADGRDFTAFLERQVALARARTG